MEANNWTQEEINQLLGLESRNLVITDDVGSGSLTETEIAEESKVKREPLAKNPLAKLMLIGGGLGIVFLALGLIVQAITQLNNSVKAEQNQPTNAVEESGPSEEETLAALKTEAALAGQEGELAKVKEKADTATGTTENSQTQLVKVEPSTPSSSATVPISSPPQRIQSPPPPTAYVPPKVVPKVPPKVSSVRSVSPAQLPIQSIDPMAQWQALAKLGSYGGGEPKQATVSSSEDRGLSTPVVANSTIIPRTQSVRDRSVSSSTQPTVLSNAVSSSTQQRERVLSEEEQFFSVSAHHQQILPGQTAQAVLTLSLVSESTTRSVQGDSVERGIITLSSPLTNSSGEVVLPSGTLMIVVVQGVHDSGRVKAIVQSVVKDGVEYPVPSGAITLQGSGGNPLIAKLVESGQSERTTANATTFMMGALSKTGELLNRGSTSTFISGGNFSQTQEFNSPNYIGGLLEGGFSPLAEQMTQQHEKRLSKLDSRSPLWVVKKGTVVEIFVNQSVSF